MQLDASGGDVRTFESTKIYDILDDYYNIEFDLNELDISVS